MKKPQSTLSNQLHQNNDDHPSQLNPIIAELNPPPPPPATITELNPLPSPMTDHTPPHLPTFTEINDRPTIPELNPHPIASYEEEPVASLIGDNFEYFAQGGAPPPAGSESYAESSSYLKKCCTCKGKILGAYKEAGCGHFHMGCFEDGGTLCDIPALKMDKETKAKAASEDLKINLFEDEDNFEEFNIDQECNEKDVKETTQQWEDDWDDDHDFLNNLCKELESCSLKEGK